MARGWESKSVESQIDSAHSARYQVKAVGPDPADVEVLRRKEILVLSRTRIMRELESSQNARYRKILNSALADLNAKLSELTKGGGAAKAATVTS
jgi:hypothetical protein